MSIEYVKVFDIDTRKVFSMPVNELAPGMILAKIEGIEEPVWVDSTRLTLAACKHPPFSGELREAIIKIQRALEEVYPLSYEFWESGFRRDNHPDNEIQIWGHIADVYTEHTLANADLSFEEKNDIFNLLVACSNSTKDNVLNIVSLSKLDIEQAKKIIEKYY